ncbi:F-box/LRR-repeat protein At3g59200-like [Papaver somniferum]|uniref:F-box/LRR-repeat protein At3g59200-like n=1 Tax=Papaver somniferum TaxID=3469 RepID=UPI000E7020A5|nr:F-box/LRR-repeat protein At3g59200-like [Papaver somniferum]
MGVGEDRISKLPDPFVHHILSFLPTKCAVSTTILSKRWENVWVSIPVLDFLDMGPRRIILTGGRAYDEQATMLETYKFMDFMDRVLIQRNMLNIKKFCLNCENGYFDRKRVNSWITTAMKCEVEEFILFGEQYWLELPDSISLPRLKIFRLTEIIFDDEKLARKLFSSCPVLEELYLTNCGWENFDFISFSAPALKFFTLTGGGISRMEYARIKD